MNLTDPHASKPKVIRVNFIQRNTKRYISQLSTFNFNCLVRFRLRLRAPCRKWGRNGAVVRALASHQCDPGSISGFDAIWGLTLLVLYSASRGFSPGIIIARASESNTNLWGYGATNLEISCLSSPDYKCHALGIGFWGTLGISSSRRVTVFRLPSDTERHRTNARLITWQKKP